MKITAICGSRNPQGQTAQAADAVLMGAEGKGASVQRIFLPTQTIQRCRQCNDDGWGICRRRGECVIPDDFASIVELLRQSDGVIFATPVYYADLSESMRAFTDRLRRICTHEAGNNGIEKTPAVGLCIAGGGGGGAPHCGTSLEHVVIGSKFNLIDMISLRRQNLQAKKPQLEMTGAWLVRQCDSA